MATDRKSIPILREPLDTLRTKKTSVDNSASHPVQLIQEEHNVNIAEGKMRMLAKIHGVHVPMRMKMDQTILSQHKRLHVPGMKPSFVGLETMLGMDETIEFEDYLNDPEFSEKQVDIHTEMEKSMFPKLRK
eukprot:CAMPEP_0170170372 /NCGR_PEP_ID=MMETSP0040_2-20121228/3369_1 /TAXON_ID=641309 /ORGANISM="Lotharella oceanica, Strain CCMP622" /LENGTH=131 /DNA_ID=CAMNT_0010409741 /DNA_START=38 /DNA_END=433 /DNA_ORIENTATION=-